MFVPVNFYLYTILKKNKTNSCNKLFTGREKQRTQKKTNRSV